MLRRFLMVVLLAGTGGLSMRALAGIPEPDVVLYGSVCVNGVPRFGADSDVVVTAFVDVSKGEKEPVTQLIGRYGMGDSERDIYVLRIRRESGVDGSEQSANAARAGQTVTVKVQLGSDTAIVATEFPLDDAGTVRRLLLAVGDPRGIDSDSDADLRDVALLQRCFTGSGTGGLGPECAAADREPDGDVDLDDSKALIDELAGPCE